MNRLRIFHIDDQLLFRDSLKNIVQEHYPNAELYSFINADKALAYILSDLNKNKCVDIIVTDFKHIGSDVIEFAQQIRLLEKKYRIDIPILLLTMKNKSEEIKESKIKGLINDYLPKSASTNELTNVFENLLQQKRKP